MKTITKVLLCALLFSGCASIHILRNPTDKPYLVFYPPEIDFSPMVNSTTSGGTGYNPWFADGPSFPMCIKNPIASPVLVFFDLEAEHTYDDVLNGWAIVEPHKESCQLVRVLNKDLMNPPYRITYWVPITQSLIKQEDQ